MVSAPPASRQARRAGDIVDSDDSIRAQTCKRCGWRIAPPARSPRRLPCHRDGYCSSPPPEDRWEKYPIGRAPARREALREPLSARRRRKARAHTAPVRLRSRRTCASTRIARTGRVAVQLFGDRSLSGWSYRTSDQSRVLAVKALPATNRERHHHAVACL